MGKFVSLLGKSDEDCIKALLGEDFAFYPFRTPDLNDIAKKMFSCIKGVELVLLCEQEILRHKYPQSAMDIFTKDIQNRLGEIEVYLISQLKSYSKKPDELTRNLMRLSKQFGLFVQSLFYCLSIAEINIGGSYASVTIANEITGAAFDYMPYQTQSISIDHCQLGPNIIPPYSDFSEFIPTSGVLPILYAYRYQNEGDAEYCQSKETDAFWQAKKLVAEQMVEGYLQNTGSKEGKIINMLFLAIYSHLPKGKIKFEQCLKSSDFVPNLTRHIERLEARERELLERLRSVQGSEADKLTKDLDTTRWLLNNYRVQVASTSPNPEKAKHLQLARNVRNPEVREIIGF